MHENRPFQTSHTKKPIRKDHFHYFNWSKTLMPEEKKKKKTNIKKQIKSKLTFFNTRLPPLEETNKDWFSAINIRSLYFLHRYLNLRLAVSQSGLSPNLLLCTKFPWLHEWRDDSGNSLCALLIHCHLHEKKGAMFIMAV